MKILVFHDTKVFVEVLLDELVTGISTVELEAFLFFDFGRVVTCKVN